mmetsp:Transcript_36759/g.97543  ORF Transcript_36759/g.97543 Transcript_36759/m.97543 type:complete len:141 (-) Transcript_36759:1123-1545(-)
MLWHLCQTDKCTVTQGGAISENRFNGWLGTNTRAAQGSQLDICHRGLVPKDSDAMGRPKMSTKPLMLASVVPSAQIDHNNPSRAFERNRYGTTQMQMRFVPFLIFVTGFLGDQAAQDSPSKARLQIICVIGHCANHFQDG